MAVSRACVSASAASAVASAVWALVRLVCASVSAAFSASTLARMSASVSPTATLSARSTSTSIATSAWSFAAAPADGSSWASEGSAATRVVGRQCGSDDGSGERAASDQVSSTSPGSEMSASRPEPVPASRCPRWPPECNESRGCLSQAARAVSAGRREGRRRGHRRCRRRRRRRRPRAATAAAGRRRRTPPPRPAASGARASRFSSAGCSTTGIVAPSTSSGPSAATARPRSISPSTDRPASSVTWSTTQSTWSRTAPGDRPVRSRPASAAATTTRWRSTRLMSENGSRRQVPSS